MLRLQAIPTAGLWLLGLATFICLTSQYSCAQQVSPTEDSQEKPAESKPLSAEDTLRRFQLAVISADEKGVCALALPHDELEILWSGKAPNAIQKALIANQMKNMPMRPLEVGETIKVPTSKGPVEYVVKGSDVNENAAFLLPEGAPIPTRLKRIDETWRVDAAPMIAARKAAKAAAEARKRAEAGEEGEEKDEK